MIRLVLGTLIIATFAPEPLVADDPPPLSIADLAAYRTALTPGRVSAPATPVTFRELWDHPERFTGQPVAVVGRLARLFRQPAVGQFPPLVEAWVTSPRGEPFCLVFPAGEGTALPDLGSEIRFGGTFLRRISYQGGDLERIAPLVVGPVAPTTEPGGSTADSDLGPLLREARAGDWWIGLAAAGGLGLLLLRRHLSRPVAAAQPTGPAPAFHDGPASTSRESVDEETWHGDA